MGDGVILDISDPANPTVIEAVRDTDNFAFWHSTTFSNDGSKVIYTDELGGGGAATCNVGVGPEHGADGIYDLENNQLTKRAYFKISRHQTDEEICVAHNGSLIPAKGRDIMVQSWYKGGASIWDFTDSASPKEIGFFDSLPTRTCPAGTWSTYYNNGYLFSNDGQQGLDVAHRRRAHRLGRGCAPERVQRPDAVHPQAGPELTAWSRARHSLGIRDLPVVDQPTASTALPDTRRPASAPAASAS